MRTRAALKGPVTKAYRACLVSLAAALLLLPIPLAADPLTDSLSLTPTPVEVAVGESFELTLVLDSATQTKGVQFSLSFDPTALQCDSVVLGDYYDAWAAANGATVFPVGVPAVIDNVAGTVGNMGIAIIGGSGGPMGSGTIATASFTSLEEGSSQIVLATHGVADTAVPPGQVEVTVNNADVTVHPEGWVPQTPLPELNGVWGIDELAFAAGINGAMLHYDSGTWTTATSGTTATLHDVWGTAADSAFAVGDAGTVLHYDGSGWDAMSTPVSTGLQGIWGASASNVFAVGEGGVVLTYDGTSWTTMSSPVSDDLNAVWGSDASNVYAVGDNGTILHYNGSAWSAMTSGTAEALNGCWMSDDGIGYAVGDNGTILRLKDGSWNPMVSPVAVTLRDVSGGSSSDLFAVGADGTILRYGGIRWDTMDGGESHELYDVHGSSGTEAFIVGHECPILHRSANQLPPDWDLNADRVCDLYDILLIGNHWNESGMSGWIPEDLDLNGIIDLYDILLEGEHWNETW